MCSSILPRLYSIPSLCPPPLPISVLLPSLISSNNSYPPALNACPSLSLLRVLFPPRVYLSSLVSICPPLCLCLSVLPRVLLSFCHPRVFLPLHGVILPSLPIPLRSIVSSVPPSCPLPLTLPLHLLPS